MHYWYLKVNGGALSLETPYLAFVGTVVPLLGVLDLQRPVVGALRMKHTEAHVRGVRVNAGGEDVEVSPSDPRHL